ncbi:hypothetical protein M378DRAFT_807819 [Amanita muscaria Koide BX008]|uniref:C2H2-type domain-containing protein n=1 Tax=Amanita muscaria (strain Koide BX008) TaxID=946122 RepID=A0A0C2SG37_AMAMK|nr:hypothetical protein M378DRAFT_807819 [Amanita muscaria Koide BX008]
MLNRDQSAHSAAHAMYGDVIAHDDAPTIEDQASLLNDPFLLPPEASFLERSSKNVDSIIEFLDAYRQRLHATAEAMRELYHSRQRTMTEPSVKKFPALPIPNNDAFQTFTELGTSEGELGAFQYHVPPSVCLDTLRPADAHREVEIPMYSPRTEPVQHQTQWALLHSAQTNMLNRGAETLPWQGVMSEHEKRNTPFPPVYASYPQLATSENGRASEIGIDGANLCLSQQLMSPNVFIDTVEAGQGDVQSTVAGSSGGEVSELGVVSFISGGTKRYRCRCGFESASKGCMDRHRDSLQHSERKHRCPCGRLFTRDDSLKRHRKRQQH